MKHKNEFFSFKMRIEVVKIKNLSPFDKIFLCWMLSFSANHQHFFVGNDEFKRLWGVSPSTVTNAIKKLQVMGLIQKPVFNGRLRKIHPTDKLRKIAFAEDKSDEEGF